MSASGPYNQRFYRTIEAGSQRSARIVLPRIFNLVSPKSVADVGCGSGAWLAIARELGVPEVFGIDGDYVDTTALLIPKACFQSADISCPIDLHRRFDLVLSLEVAEHIPADRAGTYLDNLVALSDVIAFSAAIPNQTGRDHVNEQWPEYWAELFRHRDFVVLDCLRGPLWHDHEVERWYRQNLLLFVREAHLRATPALQEARATSRNGPLSLVHPESYAEPSLTAVRHMLRGTFRRAIRQHVLGRLS
jgi:SAM-dependent methyltransferase